MDKRQQTFKSRDDALEPLNPTSPRLRGQIRRMLPDKGFGFVQDVSDPDKPGAEYFMHKSAFLDPVEFDRLGPGDIVSFTWEMTAKGLRAFNVEVAEE